MKCLMLMTILSVLFALTPPVAGEEEQSSPERVDVHRLLQQGKDSESWPTDMVLRVDADIWISGEKDRLNFRETWEFSVDQVHQLVQEDRDGKTVESRTQSRPFDTKALCRDLLDGGIFKIAANEGPGKPENFALTDFDMGSRSIKILVDGKPVFRLGESATTQGYREPHARAFATLHENLASQARAAFVDFEARKLLEAGRDAKQCPQGMTVRLGAEMWKLGGKEVLKEDWEFTDTHIHRVAVKVSRENNELIHRHEESRPFDSSNLCKDLLDGRIFAIAVDESVENGVLLAGTGCQLGGRYIDLLVDGESVFSLSEHCAVGGYGETHAHAFAAIYARLASQARAAFQEAKASGKE